MLNVNVMAASILAQAAEDYRRALIAVRSAKVFFEDTEGLQVEATKEIEALEKFFKSSWAETLMTSAGLTGSPSGIIRQFRTIDINSVGDIWEVFENSVGELL